jgi:putative ABC transport system permease protein
MIDEYFRLAFDSIRQRKIRSWLTMIGIFIGIAAVVSLISLNQGLQNAIAEQFISLGSDKIIVQAAGGGFGPPGAAVTVPLTKDDRELIKSVKGVDIAVGRLIRIVKLNFNGEQKFTYAVTVPEDKEEINLVIEANDYQTLSGKFLESKNKNEIVLGFDVANGFFEQDILVRDKIEIQGVEFKVIGILKKSGNPQKDDSVVIPESALRSIIGIEENYDIIPLKIKLGEDVSQVEERLKKELRKAHNVEEGKEDFVVETPGQLLDILSNILLIVQGVLVGIAAISLVVGGVGIMNTMYTSVTERTREIGILKSIGARNSNILLLFLIESGLLGLFGGIFGVIIGLAISKSIELIAKQALGAALLKVEFHLFLIVAVILFASFIGAISGLFPAKQASKLKPVEALRK